MDKTPFTEADRRRLLSDLMLVDPRKPIGYLPLYTLKDLLLCDPQDVASEAEASGLRAAQFGPDKCCIKSGALYVYHPGALTELLRARGDVLAENGLVDPDQFVALIAAVWFEHDHPIFPLVVTAFDGGAPERVG